MTDGQTLKLEDFPSQTYDKIRYGDADTEHVNNTVFGVFMDTGRMGIIRHPDFMRLTPGLMMFAARFTIDYLAELRWPGTVEIGTGVRKIGNSSAVFWQALFQNGKCAATAETTLVQVDKATRRPFALAGERKAWLQKFMLT